MTDLTLYLCLVKDLSKQNYYVKSSFFICDIPLCCDSEGKVIPVQALTGPEGSRRLRLPDFKTVGT
jgi:hypothetical protein